MNGRDVYNFATRICGQAIEDAVRATGNGMRVEDLELIVPHQANVRIIDAAANRLGITTVILPERNVDDVLDLPQEVRDAMRFVPARTLDDVLKTALPAQ